MHHEPGSVGGFFRQREFFLSIPSAAYVGLLVSCITLHVVMVKSYNVKCLEMT